MNLLSGGRKHRALWATLKMLGIGKPFVGFINKEVRENVVLFIDL